MLLFFNFDRFIFPCKLSSDEFLNGSFGKIYATRIFAICPFMCKHIIFINLEHVFINTSMWFIVEYKFFATISYTYPCHNIFFKIKVYHDFQIL